MWGFYLNVIKNDLLIPILSSITESVSCSYIPLSPLYSHIRTHGHPSNSSQHELWVCEFRDTQLAAPEHVLSSSCQYTPHADWWRLQRTLVPVGWLISRLRVQWFFRVWFNCMFYWQYLFYYCVIVQSALRIVNITTTMFFIKRQVIHSLFVFNLGH